MLWIVNVNIHVNNKTGVLESENIESARYVWSVVLMAVQT